jgi:hypothetical protein
MRHELIVLFSMLGLAACTGDITAPPALPAAPPPRAAIALTTSAPMPAIATVSSNPSLPFHATYSFTIHETAGVSGNVNFWSETVMDPVTGLAGPALNFGADRVIAAAGTNHLNANGSLTITRSFDYGPAITGGAGRAINVNTVVQVADDKGNVFNALIVIRIV